MKTKIQKGKERQSQGWGRQETGAKTRGNRVIVNPYCSQVSHGEINMEVNGTC